MLQVFVCYPVTEFFRCTRIIHTTTTTYACSFSRKISLFPSLHPTLVSLLKNHSFSILIAIYGAVPYQTLSLCPNTQYLFGYYCHIIRPNNQVHQGVEGHNILYC